jgi:hypothetical protein
MKMGGVSSFRGTTYAWNTATTANQYDSVIGDTALVPFIDLNPYSIAAFSTSVSTGNQLASACDYHKMWEGTMTLKYRQNCSGSTNGGYTSFVDTDPTDNETDALGSNQIMDVAAQHSSQEWSVYTDKVLTFKTKKRMWLRQAEDADVRSVSMGHLFVFTHTGYIPPAGGLGTWFWEYDIKLYTPSSNERIITSELARGPISGGETKDVTYNVQFSSSTTLWQAPRSEIIGPASKYPVKTPYTGFISTQGVNLSVGEVVPAPTYVHGVLSLAGNVKPASVLAYLVQDGLSITSTNYYLSADSYDTSGNYLSSFELLMPYGSKPGTLSLQFSYVALATANPGASVNLKLFPSASFYSIWGMSKIPKMSALTLTKFLEKYPLENLESKLDEKDQKDDSVVVTPF